MKTTARSAAVLAAALAFALAPAALAGGSTEKYSCCTADKAAKKETAAAAGAKCDPSCPPGKCAARAGAAKKTGKTDVKKEAPKPAAR